MMIVVSDTVESFRQSGACFLLHDAASGDFISRRGRQGMSGGRFPAVPSRTPDAGTAAATDNTSSRQKLRAVLLLLPRRYNVMKNALTKAG